jgi:signal transduction histidine kinase
VGNPNKAGVVRYDHGCRSTGRPESWHASFANQEWRALLATLGNAELHNTEELLMGLVRSTIRWEAVLAVLTVAVVALVHTSTSESHLLLNGHYIIVWGVAYVLMKRRALTLMIFVMTVAVGTDSAQAYFERNVGHANLVVDIGIWVVLLFLFGLLVREAYLINVEARRMQVQRTIENKLASARSAALTCMAHELRTPISSVVACVETLQNSMEGKLDEIELKFLGLVHESSQHLMELVNKLLDYGKAKSGQVTFSPQRIHLPELVEGAVMMIQPQASAQGVEISTHIDASVAQITADPLHVKEILLNLLSNAIKHTPAGESVRLSVEAKECDVLINVCDVGEGMTAEQVEHLFDPYYQATESDGLHGTGLGLGIARLLVNRHGGSISVDSTPGAGSLFRVRLPRDGPQKCSAEADDEETWEAALTSSQETGSMASLGPADAEVLQP